MVRNQSSLHHHPIPYETRLAQCLAGFSFQQAVGQFVALAGG